jgi:hypothetical protein
VGEEDTLFACIERIQGITSQLSVQQDQQLLCSLDGYFFVCYRLCKDMKYIEDEELFHVHFTFYFHIDFAGNSKLSHHSTHPTHRISSHRKSGTCNYHNPLTFLFHIHYGSSLYSSTNSTHTQHSKM